MKDYLKMIAARNIQALIEKRGLPPVGLAREANLNRTGVFDILKGRVKNPRLDTMEKIATAIGVTVQELLTDMPDDSLRVTIAAKIDSQPHSTRVSIDAMFDLMIAQTQSK